MSVCVCVCVCVCACVRVSLVSGEKHLLDTVDLSLARRPSGVTEPDHVIQGQQLLHQRVRESLWRKRRGV